MPHMIQSDSLRVTFNNIGAEIQSIRSQKTNTEFIWQGDPAFWTGRAPILFPLVGGLKNGQYRYNDRTYTLTKHGFARTSYFYRVNKEQENKLVFELVDNPATRKAFPFKFSLLIEYVLNNNTLDIAYRVINQSDSEMFFSLGAHEAYRCPRYEGEAFTDYYVEFDRSGTLETYPINQNALITDYHFPAVTDSAVLPLKHELFEGDALIFKSIESKRLSIKSHKSPAVIDISYDAPHLGIWQKVGAPFICIEPWCGLPDNEGTDGDFTRKEANNRLDANSEFVFKHAITIQE